MYSQPEPINLGQVLFLLGGVATYAELVAWYVRRLRQRTPAGVPVKVTWVMLVLLAAAGVLIDVYRSGAWVLRNLNRWLLRPVAENVRREWRIRRARRRPTVANVVATALPAPGTEDIAYAQGVIHVRSDGSAIFEPLEVGS
jgi:hypothetical protein